MSVLTIVRVLAAGVFVVALLASLAVWGLPRQTTEVLAKVQRLQAGAKYGEQKLGSGVTLSYLDSDPLAEAKPVLLLVHGITSNKDIWLPLLKRYPEYRVIAVDLPGHGDSREPAGFDYRVENLAAQLAGFVEALQLGDIHLVGNSLGGLVSGLYSADHPDKVASLVLMNTAGIDAPVKSDFMQQALGDAGRHFNPLLVKTADDFDTKLAAVVARPPVLPAPVRRLAVAQELDRIEINTLLFDAVLADETNMHKLEPLLPRLQPPVLVLWGDSDRVFHASTVERAKQLAPAVQTEVLANCGHLPMIEATGRTATAMRAFFTLSAHSSQTSSPSQTSQSVRSGT
ncbi:pimeloyl-ACP methyl ester carboxylesterase [Litorivivens lipolytica]|uniref:Pimeloyl-ACP methyl ester carboxylesterase n=1 Tax=Litorivivens lipolytica TaxID=1524264 RepID=A0A7W4Z5K9_9GAMM|nr:alpha/beta hydrolase [Litorivivens lipolytica]MBB3047222.1 pimeloyl-ACP methyl ester carboxylesterase [Litorivivens lipolytica]